MSVNLAEAWVILNGKKDNLSTTLAGAKRETENWARETGDSVHRSLGQSISGGIGGFVSNLVGGLGQIGLASMGIKSVIDGVAGLATGMVAGNAEFERYETQFGVLLGSSEKAKQRLDELAKFGASTPFSLPELVRADKVLTSFGLDSETTAAKFGVSAAQIRTTIGDVAAGTGVRFEELALTFGKFASGATGEAISRFQELGIATREEMAGWGLQFSKSGELLTPAREAFAVLESYVRGKFGGMMAAQSGTFEGMLSNLSDWLGAAKRKLMAPIFEVLKDKLQGVLDLLNSPAAQAAMDMVANTLAKGVEVAVEWVGKLIDGVGALLGYLDAGNKRDLMREWFGAEAGPYIDELVRGVTGLVQGFMDLMAQASPIIDLVKGNLQPILIGLAVAIGTVVVGAFVAWAASAAASAAATLVALAPIIAVVAVIAAVVAGLYLAWTNNFLGIQDVVNSVLGAVVPFIQRMMGIVVDWVKENWPLIQKTIETVMNAIQRVIDAVLGTILAVWRDHGDKIMTVIRSLWSIIQTVVETYIRNILGVIKGVMQLITGDWEGAWETIQDILQRTWEALVSIVQSLGPGLLAALQLVWEALKAAAGAAFNGLKGLFEAAWNALTGWIGSQIENAKNSAAALGNAIKDGIVGGIRGTLGVIGDLGEQLLSALKGIINSAIDWINDAIPNGLTLTILGQEFGIDLPDNPLPHLARGSTFFAGGLALVGEEGPELVRLPQGARVWSAGESQGAMTTVNHNYYLTVNSRQESRQLINDFALMRARAGGR